MERGGGLAQILDFRQPPLKLSGGFHLIREPVHPILRKPDTRSQDTKYKHNSGGRTKNSLSPRHYQFCLPFGFKQREMVDKLHLFILLSSVNDNVLRCSVYCWVQVGEGGGCI